VTPAGNFTVQHTAKTNGQAQPTITGKSGSTCYLKLDGGTGTYTVLGSKSTGKFAGATGSGTYAITILAEANLLPGKTTCSANDTGNAIAKGASITFKATGPLTLKQ
jgi:allophanate hydrolase subunit 2